jgi:hypothetical protein
VSVTVIAEQGIARDADVVDPVAIDGLRSFACEGVRSR